MITEAEQRGIRIEDVDYQLVTWIKKTELLLLLLLLLLLCNS